MNHADWTPSTHTERASRLLRRRVRWGGLHLIGAAVSLLGTMVGVMWLADHHFLGRPLQIALALLATVSAGATTVWLAMRDHALRRDAARPDQARREEFGAGEGWLVEIIVLQGAAPTGSDRGMLWIEGSRLVFAGDRTAFALSGNDVAGHIRAEEAIGGLRHPFRLPLARRTAAGPLALSVNVVSSFGKRGLEEIDRWAVRAPRFDGQLPPIRPGPGSATRPRLFVKAALVTVYSVGLVVLGIDALLSGILFPGVLFIALSSGVWFPGFRQIGTHWQAWRDLGRVGP